MNPPTPCRIKLPKFAEALIADNESLKSVSIPAGNRSIEFQKNLTQKNLGGFIAMTFYMTDDQTLEFYLKHEKEFTMNIYFTSSKKVFYCEIFRICSKQAHDNSPKFVKNLDEDIDDQMKEVFAGCGIFYFIRLI